jgi:hypothetical protein
MIFRPKVVTAIATEDQQPNGGAYLGARHVQECQVSKTKQRPKDSEVPKNTTAMTLFHYATLLPAP